MYTTMAIRMLDSSAILLLVLQSCCVTTIFYHYSTDAYTHTPRNNYFAYKNVKHNIIRRHNFPTFLSAVPRYGPPESSSNNYSTNNDSLKSPEEEEEQLLQSSPSSPSLNNNNNNANDVKIIKIKEEFRNLVESVMQISQAELIPRLLVNNIELIMGLQGEEGTQVISSLLEDAKKKKKETTTTTSDITNDDDDDDDDDDDSYYSQTIQTVEMILTFAEDFVKEAHNMDKSNKNLLGKIMKAMVKSDNDTSISGGEGGKEELSAIGARSREEALDKVMKEEKINFTTGFLRHIEGECNRIENAQRMTTESTRLLEILRLIQTRVLEELGQDLGEAALVLGQLMGYDKEEELLGVLEAGLTVQGRDFALEMASLTEEALDGFKRIPGGADPELVQKVNFIDKRLQEYLNETNEFQ
ncbi:MAG: hypothetical protein ACI8RD_012249 [Bacillariaceae sp.]